MTEFPETRSALLVEVRSPENREAWEQFVLVYRPVIYRMARRRGMQDADAQDVAQNILVRVAARSIAGNNSPVRGFGTGCGAWRGMRF